METQSAVTFARIYLHEADHGRRRNLMQEILATLKDRHGVRNVTVFRGVAGVDEHGEVLAENMLRLTVDLPLVIEFYERDEIVRAAIDTLNGLVTGHAIVTWPARLME
jgi:PII-like signaling protein